MDSAGAKSNLSEDIQELSQGGERISNSIAGHKAAISNPNTSAAAKAKSAKAIEELGGEATQEAVRENPTSKSAAENLGGSRAAAA